MTKNDEKWIKYGKLLSGLIHNLNTPIMGVSGRVELLQIKMGEDKSLIQISTQVERINKMLSSAGYLVDKDMYDKVIEVDVDVFLSHFYEFMTADMRFKHHTNKELAFTPAKVTTNPSDLLFVVHSLVDYILSFADDDTTIISKNNDSTVIYISMRNKDHISAECNITKLCDDKFDEELKKNYLISHNIADNLVNIEIDIKG
jgi:signal transduction histidine kinase